MLTLLSAIGSLLLFRMRSSAALELTPWPAALLSVDRLFWMWLYRIWPQVLDAAMVLVKPATVVQWHRKGSASTGAADHVPWDGPV